MGTLLVLGLLVGLVYVVRTTWRPFVPCRRCEGAGERRRRFSRSTVRCVRCDGLGERLRLGVRLWHVSTGRGR